ncbi:BatC protein [Leifsonia poae]|nr:BatC protein [Leifsonia poae]
MSTSTHVRPARSVSVDGDRRRTAKWRLYMSSINDDDITTDPASGGEGPADGGANPNGHDGGADGGAGEGTADGGANPGGHDGGADGSAGEGPADGGANAGGHDGGADGSA